MAEQTLTPKALEQTIAGGQLYFRTLMLMIHSQLKQGLTDNVLGGIDATLAELQGDLPVEDRMSRAQTITALQLLRTLITDHGADAAVAALEQVLQTL